MRLERQFRQSHMASASVCFFKADFLNHFTRVILNKVRELSC